MYLTTSLFINNIIACNKLSIFQIYQLSHFLQYFFSKYATGKLNDVNKSLLSMNL